MEAAGLAPDISRNGAPHSLRTFAFTSERTRPLYRIPGPRANSGGSGAAERDEASLRCLGDLTLAFGETRQALCMSQEA